MLTICVNSGLYIDCELPWKQYVWNTFLRVRVCERVWIKVYSYKVCRAVNGAKVALGKLEMRLPLKDLKNRIYKRWWMEFWSINYYNSKKKPIIATKTTTRTTRTSTYQDQKEKEQQRSDGYVSGRQFLKIKWEHTDTQSQNK